MMPIFEECLLVIEFIFYAACAGAAMHGLIYAFTKDHGTSLILAVLAGLVVVYFFPDPTHAETLGDMATNVTRVIDKVIYLAAWVGGTCAVQFIFGRSQT